MVDLVDGTPARVFVGRVGTSYRTSMLLRLRSDLAAAKDALGATVDLGSPPMSELVARHGIFELPTSAPDHATHLARPDLGRRLSPAAVGMIADLSNEVVDVQVVIGDGLSARAVTTQVPELLDDLLDSIRAKGWSCPSPLFVRHCRVGVMNDIGDATGARNVVLLIGERPGASTAESLSIYLAHAPRRGHTDADRNLVSNIHAAGVAPADAVRRTVALLERFELRGVSGFTVKEAEFPTSIIGPDAR